MPIRELDPGDPGLSREQVDKLLFKWLGIQSRECNGTMAEWSEKGSLDGGN